MIIGRKRAGQIIIAILLSILIIAIGFVSNVDFIKYTEVKGVGKGNIAYQLNGVKELTSKQINIFKAIYKEREQLYVFTDTYGYTFMYDQKGNVEFYKEEITKEMYEKFKKRIKTDEKVQKMDFILKIRLLI